MIARRRCLLALGPSNPQHNYFCTSRAKVHGVAKGEHTGAIATARQWLSACRPPEDFTNPLLERFSDLRIVGACRFHARSAPSKPRMHLSAASACPRLGPFLSAKGQIACPPRPRFNGGMPASSPAANRPDHRQGLASAATCPWIAGFAGIAMLPGLKPSLGERVILGISNR
jgi:hypothetical protein